MKRYGRVVKVKPEMLERYKELHSNPWTEVTKAISQCNIVNFSIFHINEYLFSYFEYIGEDFQKDMKILGELTKEWLSETDQCQTPIETAATGDLWTVMEEVFYQE